jgi:hypothetical protein
MRPNPWHNKGEVLLSSTLLHVIFRKWICLCTCGGTSGCIVCGDEVRALSCCWVAWTTSVRALIGGATDRDLWKLMIMIGD